MISARERIIDITANLFHYQGYNKTGINQIIEEAKVAKATFYYHFKSKDDLCVEFLNNRHNYWVSELHKFTSEYNNPKDKILNSFNFLIFMNKRENYRGCSFLNIISEISEEQEEIRRAIQNSKTDLRNYFREHIKDELLADHIYLLFESSIIESQIFKSNELIEKSRSITERLITNI
ncbi:TetR/AcrR family transcriptional regulator [Winogradskyella psychrotolerans]|uniref:TetR/AcrR family transcriptional regulator n=1 Tax=Winogradskyella psychrotolerans TaxID=1344585 RepID=UPI001C0708E0|nr:TetR/AcrR family transcriptional regulator [Winogradskyella psychrotolerans]MBU2927087.1 TetR/AcrR family transcriptional regulator [Winogradskyella psychrotolerans]